MNKKYTPFLKKFNLLFTVFCTGGCVLVIEIVAIRILSPYFGNTIFTLSSVISVVLAALSFGYYIGGILADKYPSLKLFYGIISIGGLAVLLLQILNIFFLPFLGYKLSIISGPLISALVLFFVPSFFLAMVSPFAIKLQEINLSGKGIGKIAGSIFFWSTLGSIFGSLLTGFVLIPNFGINQIILGIGVLLVAIGVFFLVFEAGKLDGFASKILKITFVLFIIAAVFGFKKDAVYSQDGIYEKISIFDGEYMGIPTRFFQQDKSYSGAMFLDSDELVFDYTKYYELYKIFGVDIKNALVIGGGAYSIPKALLDKLPEANIDVAEIEPSLHNLGKQYFNLPDSGRMNNHIEDGRRFLHDSSGKYDLIFNDAFSSLFSVPIQMTTKEFFQIARDKLNENGIFIANFIGSLSRQSPSFLFSEIRTFQSVFPNSYFFAVESPKSINPQNIIFVGYNSDRKVDFNNEQIQDSENEIIAGLSGKKIDLDRFNLSLYQELSDNFSPIEYFTSKILQQNAKNKQEEINGGEMLSLVRQQLGYGPRFIDSVGHEKTQNFLISETNTYADKIEIQSGEYISSTGKKNEVMNIIGRFYPEKNDRIILGTHYDSKSVADKDLKYQAQPVPGANDSASGVAALLDIARYLANSPIKPNIGIDIVFFDGEEGDGSIVSDYSNWKPLGSVYFAEHIDDIYSEKKPESALIIDMVCDKNLDIYQEKTSIDNAPEQIAKFWKIARSVSPGVFNNSVGKEVKDDHTSLNSAGIPSFLVIDYNYPAFHTAQDTLDKCSADSLESVAESIVEYIYSF